MSVPQNKIFSAQAGFRGGALSPSWIMNIHGLNSETSPDGKLNCESDKNFGTCHCGYGEEAARNARNARLLLPSNAGTTTVNWLRMYASKTCVFLNYQCIICDSVTLSVATGATAMASTGPNRSEWHARQTTHTEIGGKQGLLSSPSLNLMLKPKHTGRKLLQPLI